MASNRALPQDPPSWRRMAEWSLLVVVLVVLATVFVRQVRVMQGQRELASVKSTLGALRTALVIDHLQRKVRPDHSFVGTTQPNPFELLQRRPPNYLGEMNRESAAQVPPGSWVFDVDCVCVGYRPLDGQWFESPSGERLAQFLVIGAPGPLQLSAREAYIWQDEPVN